MTTTEIAILKALVDHHGTTRIVLALENYCKTEANHARIWELNEKKAYWHTLRAQCLSAVRVELSKIDE